MPEGHTLHRLAQALDAAFAGSRPQATSPQGRFADGAALVDGRRLERATAYGKHLFLDHEGGLTTNVHLGLIGKFSVERYDAPSGPPPVWGAVRLRLLTDTHVADLRGATVCQVVTPEQVAAIVAKLGPDPLRADADPEQAWTRLHRSGRSVAELLMDQSVLAGVGNVYRCEVLFRHRVDPFRPGRQIRPETWRAIWDDLVRLLPLGVAFNQILTMEDQVLEAEELVARDEVPVLVAVHTDSARRVMSGPAGVLAAAVSDESAADLADDSEGAGLDEDDAGATAGFERRYHVYRRAGEPCVVCGSRVRTRIVAGRNLFWCGRCQRRR
ncbi:Fpg/Nei family DNA glycosylase [Lapillicoccus jejuensis]|uniref:DNA-(apurinic or apyrimidinic site) lyase n=1 Tax=Lapillicoccus jejuensis TaxID=402171 RepID=A0A542DXE1_9MICO|nr:DNA-formamidopyrimidine glycosylase family protein [Lapillicoccus jejuensis]TQJ07746.1 endonuclease-8 [Lapillicoccus jejuensis]